MGTPSHVKLKKGVKTDAILHLLEAQGASLLAVLAPQTGLMPKEVSSRVSMLVSQGRVVRERGDDGVQRVRFLGWKIKHSRVVVPEPEQEIPMLEQVWGIPAVARQLAALADAVAALATETRGAKGNAPKGRPLSVTGPVGIGAAGRGAEGADQSEQVDQIEQRARIDRIKQRHAFLGVAATPFVQVMLQAQVDGRVHVRTHCIVGPDDEKLPAARDRRSGGRSASTGKRAEPKQDFSMVDASVSAEPATSVAGRGAPAAKPRRTVARTADSPRAAMAVPPAFLAECRVMAGAPPSAAGASPFQSTLF